MYAVGKEMIVVFFSNIHEQSLKRIDANRKRPIQIVIAHSCLMSQAVSVNTHQKMFISPDVK